MKRKSKAKVQPKVRPRSLWGCYDPHGEMWFAGVTPERQGRIESTLNFPVEDSAKRDFMDFCETLGVKGRWSE